MPSDDDKMSKDTVVPRIGRNTTHENFEEDMLAHLEACGLDEASGYYTQPDGDCDCPRTFAGTLDVTGATTVTGATALNGGLTMDTDKFTVADDTGNTAVGGTLDVTGATDLNGG